MYNANYVTKQEKERRIKEADELKTNETKAARTINMPISYWALLDQVKTKLCLKNTNRTIMFLVMNAGKEIGIES